MVSVHRGTHPLTLVGVQIMTRFVISSRYLLKQLLIFSNWSVVNSQWYHQSGKCWYGFMHVYACLGNRSKSNMLTNKTSKILFWRNNDKWVWATQIDTRVVSGSLPSFVFFSHLYTNQLLDFCHQPINVHVINMHIHTSNRKNYDSL